MFAELNFNYNLAKSYFNSMEIQFHEIMMEFNGNLLEIHWK